MSSLDCGESQRALRVHAAEGNLRIDVTNAGVVLTEALRGDVRRRVLLALSRFGPQLRRVTACLVASPNPLGGVDQRCRMRARLCSGAVLRAEAINGKIETAVERSAANLALLVAAALDDGLGRDRRGAPLRPASGS